MAETDRFSSREDVTWNPEAESQGRIARLSGFAQDDPAANPYERDTWLWRSFCAGWCDADQGYAADLREQLQQLTAERDAANAKLARLEHLLGVMDVNVCPSMCGVSIEATVDQFFEFAGILEQYKTPDAEAKS